MKPRNILKAAVLLALTSSAMADATIDVTGATAVRATTLQAIYTAYASVANAITNNVFNTFNVAYDFTGNNSATMIKANVVTFKGSYPGITGTTVIRCSFNGSVEGLKAIATTNEPASFLTAAAVTNSGTFQGGTTTPTESVRPKFAFSDVLQANTPVTNSLNPESPGVGVVTFMPIANIASRPSSATSTGNPHVQPSRLRLKTCSALLLTPARSRRSLRNTPCQTAFPIYGPPMSLDTQQIVMVRSTCGMSRMSW
jgi:hypothetical protein